MNDSQIKTNLVAKDIAIAIDLSTTDESLLRFTKYLCSKLACKKLNLIHIIPTILSSEIADSNIKEKIDLSFSLKDKIKERILRKKQAILQDKVKSEITVVEGNPCQTFLETAAFLKAKFVIVGRKHQSGGSGITAQKIARKFEGNVLFVPEDASTSIQQIFVPIDFSENAARALRFALDLSRKIKDSKINCVHVVRSLPENYQIDLKTRSALDARFREKAMYHWKDFLTKNAWDKAEIPMKFIQNNALSVADHLKEYANDQQANMMVIGAKGHTAFESFMNVSVTEELLQGCRM